MHAYFSKIMKDVIIDFTPFFPHLGTTMARFTVEKAEASLTLLLFCSITCIFEITLKLLFRQKNKSISTDN